MVAISPDSSLSFHQKTRVKAVRKAPSGRQGSGPDVRSRQTMRALASSAPPLSINASHCVISMRRCSKARL